LTVVLEVLRLRVLLTLMAQSLTLLT
jgi:hypothetical protein